MLRFDIFLLVAQGSLSLAAPQSSQNVVSVPQQYTYLLPDGYEGNTNYTFVNGTHTSSNKVNSILTAAQKAPIISYDQEFLDIVGSNPEVKLIEERQNDDFAYEMGVWVPERNEVWFTSAVEQGHVIAPTLYALNLGTNDVSKVQASEEIINANGGYYFEGKVYIATYPNNASYSGGIISVEVNTLQVETVLNSYFGLRYNGIDDIAWATGSDGCKYMYFTDLDFAYLGYDNLPPLQLPANVYRWDPQNQVVLPVITRNELNPNGVRVSPDMKTLYVTDSTATFAGAGPYSPASGPSDVFWLGPYIYAFDLDSRMLPVNRRVFGMARQGIADGLHIDDVGNVYTGEWEGVVVRNPAGKTIGVFNSQFFQADKHADALAMANFALAGDTLVFLSTTRLWTVKLAKTVVSQNSPIVN
jgi:gluconolactonase